MRLNTAVFLLAAVSAVTEAGNDNSASHEIKCYSCSSHIDPSCISKPSTTTSCPTSHGRGCTTRLLLDGLIERGCSSIGLSPSGCRVSEIAGSECVCHKERCNTRVMVEAAYSNHGDRSTLTCYQCDSIQDSKCTHDIDADSTKLNTCPAANGCYLNKRVSEDGLMLYHRLCFNGSAPATYYPGGCYTVFNQHSSTTTEACVCYTDKCNRNSLTSLQSLEMKGTEPTSISNYIAPSLRLLTTALVAKLLHS